MFRKIKDKLYYYFAEKNWGVRREYGPYVDAHREEHRNKRWKHWWMLVRLNWHYRVLRRDSVLYYTSPESPQGKRRLPYLDGAESELSKRSAAIIFAKSLLQYDVVSFDIFDTLILRPFAKPADLFMLVGKRLDRTEFYRIRTEAEKRAREIAMIKKGNHEVTIDDIYTIVEERTGIPKESGIQAEFETELQYCFANPYMKRVFRLLHEQGKPIIIVSDMYLPQEMMNQLLQNAGYTGYEKLYISCDFDCSKRSGSLYEYVKRDYPEKKIVHIGDNMASDIKAAEKVGIATKYYRNCHEIGAPYRADGMSELIGSAYAGIVNTHLHNGIRTYSPYYEYGFTYGGLYILGFCQWMHTKAKREGIDKILFLSRDGDIYQKVFNMLFEDVPNEYFLWSRIANTKYTALKNRDDFLRRCIFYRVLRPEEVITIDSLLETLSLQSLKPFLGQYHLNENTLLTREKQMLIEKFFIDHWDVVVAAYSEEKTVLRNYLNSKVGNASKIAIVDVGWLGSGPLGLKYLIEEEFQMDCKVHCWEAASRPPRPEDIGTSLLDGTIEPYIFSRSYNRNHYDTHTNTNKGMNNIFFELFTQAQYPSFCGFSSRGDTQFDFPEVESYHIIEEIHRGIVDFVKIYHETFEKDPFLYYIPGYDAYCPFRTAIRDMAYPKKFFAHMPYARGVGGDSKNMKMSTIGEIMKGVGT